MKKLLRRRLLLVICGPTATGKTGLALKLAEKFDAEIVSADSRQVYRNLDIGTGKDIPKTAKYDKGGFYKLNNVRVWGYDLIEPKEEFSVSEYVDFAREAIKSIWSRNKLAILVGGTGLYIQGVVNGIQTAKIPKNRQLRKSLGERDYKELFEQLAVLDPIKAGSMNISDRKNPRRLIRAIEIAQWQIKGREKENNDYKILVDEKNCLFVGLNAPRSFLNKKIARRVEERIKKGIEREIKELLDSGVTWKDQSMLSLGYRQWMGYFSGEKTKEKAIQDWEKEEIKYARRQMTWFKKDKRISWFDVTDRDYPKNVEKLVKTWYIEK